MKQIPGFGEHYAGEDGLVYRFKKNGFKQIAVGKSKKSPYLNVTLSIKGKNVRRNIHKLVLLAYKGPRPNGLEARHLDGDVNNNKPNNLCWGTRAENVNDKKIHGTIPKGERNGRAILTIGQVNEIKELKGKVPAIVLAKKFNVAATTISAIHVGRSWAK